MRSSLRLWRLPRDPPYPTTPRPAAAMLPPFVESHPAPRLHSGRLNRRVRQLQPEPQGVVAGIAEVGVGLALESGNLGGDFGQVSGYVPDGVGVVPGPRVRMLAHPLRIRQRRQIP